MNLTESKHISIARLTNLLIELEDQKQLIEARGDLEKMIAHYNKINKVLDFLDVLTK